MRLAISLLYNEDLDWFLAWIEYTRRAVQARGRLKPAKPVALRGSVSSAFIVYSVCC